MGRIITRVNVQGFKAPALSLSFEALVDTGAAYLVLPSAWREQLGELDHIRDVTVQLGNQSQISGSVWGPVRIEIEGFSPVYSEALFIDMDEEFDIPEPLLGYIPLEQSQAAVDLANHRLIKVKYVDLKFAA